MHGDDDKALATVVGALIIISLLGMSLVYINAFYVPDQGSALEVQTRNEAQRALLDIGTRLSGGPVPFVVDLPLKALRPAPPLLDGIVLSPVRADGRLVFDPSAAQVSIFYNTTLESADGLTRVDNGDGTMRVYVLGNATTGRALGGLNLSVGGAYLEEATYRLVGGALFINRAGGDTLVAPPALQMGQTGAITSVSWRIPILTGSVGEVGGRESAQISLVPGPVARAGSGQLAYNTTIRVVTPNALSAWTDALTAVVDCGTCTITATPDPGNPSGGSVVAIIESTTPGTATVSLDYSAVRYSLSVTERASG